MPIYEYMCSQCSSIEEHFLRSSDTEPEKCAKCGSSLARIVSQTTFALKGSGWYVTDYKPASTDPHTGAKAEGSSEVSVSAGEQKSGAKDELSKDLNESQSTPIAKESSTPKAESSAKVSNQSKAPPHKPAPEKSPSLDSAKTVS
jgi:putative FmdB family regulatory protein